MIAELKAWFKRDRMTIYAWIFGLFFALQAANVAAYLALNTNQQAIVASNDDDAGMVVKLAVKTRWWKDNGLATYGPAFFRTAHTIHYFLGETAAPKGTEAHENWERTAHFSVMLVSLFSLVGTSLLLASLLVKAWATRFVLGIGFLSAFVAHPVWTEFLLRAHPDHMFAFVALAAFVMMVRHLNEPANKFWYYASSLMWGISASVKMSISLWVPGFFLLFFPPFNKKTGMAALRYAGLIFLGYFLIGFPQSIVLDRPVKMVLLLNGLGLPPTMDSFKLMVEQILTQSMRPIAVLALGFLLFADLKYKWKLSRVTWIRVILFCTIPFAFLLRKNMTVPMTHYPIPVVTLIFGLMALGFQRVKWSAFERVPYLARVLVFGAVVWFGWGFTPTTLNAQLDHWQRCRKESSETLTHMKKLLADGHNIWVDPYVPYDTQAPKTRQHIEWKKGWQGAKERGITAVAIQRPYAEQFLGEGQPNAFVLGSIPEWPGVREFYTPFAKGEVAETPLGTFKVVYSNSCGHQLWAKENK